MSTLYSNEGETPQPVTILQLDREAVNRLDDRQKSLLHRVMQLAVEKDYLHATEWDQDEYRLINGDPASRDSTMWGREDTFDNLLKKNAPRSHERFLKKMQQSLDLMDEKRKQANAIEHELGEVSAHFFSIIGAPCPLPGKGAQDGRYEKRQQLADLKKCQHNVPKAFAEWILDEVTQKDSDLGTMLTAAAQQQERRELNDELQEIQNGYIMIDPKRLQEKGTIFITVSHATVKIEKERSGKLTIHWENIGFAHKWLYAFQMVEGCLKIPVPEEGTILVKNEYVHSNIISIHPENNGQEGQEED